MNRLIIATFVLIPFCLTAQWEIVCNEKWGYYTSLDLVNDSLGFITTEDGYILRTTDKGLNWSPINKLNRALSDIQFVDEQHGWVTGRDYYDHWNMDSLRILRTVDGGYSWSILEKDPIYFEEYQFVAPEKGWAIGYKDYNNFDPQLIYTLDGGKNWFDADTNAGLSNKIRYFRFVNEEIGWAVGSYDLLEQKLYKTEDGGNNWISFNYQNEIQTILPASDSICYLFFEKSIHKTMDGGSQWTIYTNTQCMGSMKIWDSLNDSSFIFTASGGLHEPDVILKTTNGFKTAENVYSFGGLSGGGIGSFWASSYVEFFDNSNGISLNNSYLMTTNDKGENWKIVNSRQNFEQINFTNGHVGYSIDLDRNWYEFNGSLYKTENSGKSWNLVRENSAALHFINNDTGFVAGQNSILKTIDGGNTWQVKLTDNDLGISRISFCDDKNGFALTLARDNYIYKTNNCGENWDKVSFGVVADIWDLNYFNENVIYMIGNDLNFEGILLRSTDGGNYWDEIKTVGLNFTKINQISPTLGFAIGSYATRSTPVIYRSDDSWSDVKNWVKQYEIDSGFLNSIYMIDSLSGYVCGTYYNEGYGKYGYILKTTDGGANWEENYSIRDIELNDIQFIDENTGWAVGEKGTVLKTTNGGVTWAEKEQENIPNEILLYQNYPNPFNPSTAIKFSIPHPSADGVNSESAIVNNVTLKIFDILGRELATLVNEKQKPGNYEIEFDGSDLTSGIYFYRLRTSEFVKTKKMLLLK